MIVAAISIIVVMRLQTDAAHVLFPWWGYLVAALAYTALVFRDDGWSKEGPLHFSKLTASTALRFVVIHTGFLAILVVFLQATIMFLPAFPSWMTDPFHVRRVDISMLGIFVILAVVALHFVERRWLFAVYSKTYK